MNGCFYIFYIVNVYFVAGVIDQDYRGNVGVVLFNHADQDFEGKLKNAFKKYYFVYKDWF